MGLRDYILGLGVEYQRRFLERLYGARIVAVVGKLDHQATPARITRRVLYGFLFTKVLPSLCNKTEREREKRGVKTNGFSSNPKSDTKHILQLLRQHRPGSHGHLHRTLQTSDVCT